MSRFTSDYINSIEPYEPGEQPRDRQYIKLNTNENPFSPSDEVTRNITEEILKNLRRYPDPCAHFATKSLANSLDVKEDNVLLTNGSDEAIAFSFLAFGDNGIVFPDVTYSFYKNIANVFKIPYSTMPLDADFKVCAKDYFHAGKTVVLANPNAQTGIATSMADLEEIIRNNVDNVVIVDQAYSAFSACDAIPLISEYKNLVVIETFSKCRSLAGARLGYIVADKDLIDDIKKIKYSFNPYNVNTVSQILATASAKDDSTVIDNIAKVVSFREELKIQLKLLGFKVLPSEANFICAKNDAIDGKTMYLKLRDKGILVRHFSDARINDYIRITVGREDENKLLLVAIKEILGETK